ncbi:MAG: DUF6901 family protein [Methylomonas sp.]
MRDQKLHFLYRLRFPDGKLIEFPIEIDAISCSYIPPTELIPQKWTDLDYQKCSNCPLHKTTSPFCPVAINLMSILKLCSTSVSYQKVSLEVVTAERTISAETTMQRTLSSILGLIMATSPCPHTEYLKPMARFHLPLASEDETIYRTTSMYLLAQYFRRKNGLDFSLELDNLKVIYQNLQIVNRALASRLKAAVAEDATINAVILLDLLSQAVTWSIEEGLEEIRHLFKSYEANSSTAS